MKKRLFLAICLFSISRLSAQTYIAGHMHVVASDSMYNDSASCTANDNIGFDIIIDSSYTGEVLNIVDTLGGYLLLGSPFVNTTGASPWVFTVPRTYGWGLGDESIYGGYVYFHYHIPVMKMTCGPDTLRYVINNDSLLVTNACLYDTVEGHVYIDNNLNCVEDGGDVGLSQVVPSINDSLHGTSTTYYYPYSGGSDGYYKYLIQKSWMVNYTVSLPPAYAFIFPFSPCFTTTSYTSTTLPGSNMDFPLLCTSLVDVQCNALSPGRIRLHRSFYIQPYTTNTGCDSASGEMHFIKDHRVIYDASLSAHPADTVHGDTLIWNYSGLSNISAGGYWNSFLADVYLTPDASVAVGDSLCFSGYATTPLTDVNTANNSFSFCIPVVYSFDPNSKEVSPAGTGTIGRIPVGTDTLTYTLHFQNTGSDVAENIKVIDTLDSHITAKSLKILGTSHNMTPEWLTPHVVRFNYDGINLPDSGANEAASHGQVRFSVALNAGLPAGTQIKNTGYIYFDANPPVITNTTLNTLELPGGVARITSSTGISLYPNPASDQLFVEHLNGGEISVLNINGTVLIHNAVTGDKTTVDISALPGGIYILKTLSNDNTATIKFTKY